MRRLLTFAVCCLVFAVYCSYADALTSNELIENAKSLDGKPVTYKGEVVTAILNRGEYSWINLNDGYNAIGIWCKTQALDSVKFIGSYKCKGDILECEGIFNRACPVHGGELDIHAGKVRFVKSGFLVEERMDKKIAPLSIALFLITLSLAIIFRRRN